MEQKTKATRSDRDERREQLHQLRPETAKTTKRTRKRMAWGDHEEHREQGAATRIAPRVDDSGGNALL